MVRLTNLRDRSPAKRPKVAVVHEDVSTGFRFADWFAQRGYQPTLTSMVPQLERNLLELHPDVIVVGLSGMPTLLHSTVPRLRTTCPHVPIIAVVEEGLTDWRPGPDSDLINTLGAGVFMCRSLDPLAAQ